MKIRWIDTSCFEIETNQGRRIVTDPYIDECPNHPVPAEAVGPVDYVVVSHTHFDHITQLNRFYERYRCKIMASPITVMKLVEAMDLSGQCMYPMDDGETLDFGDCAVTRVNSHHTIPARGDRHLARESQIAESLHKQWPPDAMYDRLMSGGYWDFSGFFFETADNTRILFWGGGAGYMDIQKARAFRPDILLMQIPSNPAEKIAEFVKAIGAPLVIPHHQDCYLTTRDVAKMMADYGRVIEAANPATRFLPLEPGKWYTFQKTMQPE